MRKLALNDAAFLYNETTRTPMHIASVQHMRLAEGIDGESFTRALREQISSRLHRVPYLSERIVEAPWQMDHPSFIGTEVQMSKHVHRVTAPSPGDTRALEATVARLHSRPLDRNRPLWEMVVIDGLEDGRVAIYNRVHHCCIDGMSGQEATRLMYESPEAEPSATEAGPKVQNDAEHPAVAMIHALEDFGHFTDALARGMPDTVRSWDRVLQRLAGDGTSWNGGFGSAPDTPFNRPVGSLRTWSTGVMSLAELKAMGRTCGATLNDVVLAVCGGGLRRYFERTAQLPDPTLLAGCPVSLRKSGDKSLNNQVGMMRVGLGTHLANPLVRLLYVKESSRRARHLTLDAIGLMPPPVSLPGLPAALRFSAMAADWMATAAGPMTMPVNVIISNVPGPTGLLHPAGALMESHYPVSIAAHGLAVNLTVQSYAGAVHLGITACARALPDAGVLRDDLMAAFSELRAASHGTRSVPCATALAEGQSRSCLPAPTPVVELQPRELSGPAAEEPRRAA